MFDAKEYGRQYRELNKDKIAAKKREWYARNRDKISESRRVYNEINRESRLAYHKEWKFRNPEKVALIETRRRLKKKYNMTLKDYENLLEKQGGRCAICLSVQKERKLVVDHCHKTHSVRGLLCNSCNRGIGLLQDSATVLKSAFEYISKVS